MNSRGAQGSGRPAFPLGIARRHASPGPRQHDRPGAEAHARPAAVLHWFILLAAASFTLSLVTAVARGKLWLGPQTAILGGVGICFGFAAASWRVGRYRVPVAARTLLSALAWRFRARGFRFYDVLPIANFVMFLIFADLGSFQMGPRYWLDGFVAMHLTVGSVFGAQDIAWRRFAVACCALLLPVSLARLPAQVAFHARAMRERSSMFRLGAALPSDERAVMCPMRQSMPVPSFPTGRSWISISTMPILTGGSPR